MKFLQIWRTARKRDAEGFAQFLARILEWARGSFKEGIVEKLDRVQSIEPLGNCQYEQK
jgi:hypothetical protein